MFCMILKDRLLAPCLMTPGSLIGSLFPKTFSCAQFFPQEFLSFGLILPIKCKTRGDHLSENECPPSSNCYGVCLNNQLELSLIVSHSPGGLGEHSTSYVHRKCWQLKTSWAKSSPSEERIHPWQENVAHCRQRQTFRWDQVHKLFLREGTSVYPGGLNGHAQGKLTIGLHP